MRVKMGTVVPKMGTFVHLREKLRASGDVIALDTATHFAFRQECMSCPVVQLCKGSCMFLEGEFFKQHCSNELAFKNQLFSFKLLDLSAPDAVVDEFSKQDAVLSCLPFQLKFALVQAAHDAGVHYFHLTEDEPTTNAIIQMSKNTKCMTFQNKGATTGISKDI